MSKPNWENRTLFHGDNLDFMRAMNSESVDLIATDPPFNKGRDFHATPDSLSAGASFQDRWSWENDIHQQWIDSIQDDWPNVWEVIQSSRKSWGDDMGAYLCFMGVRLIAMWRILKSTGSIYLHCDPTASHYLKLLMDAIFERRNFRNEIVWCYKTGGMSKRWFGRKHDILLFYSKSEDYKFNPLKEKSYLSHKYGFSNVTILEDEVGPYTLAGVRDYWDIPAIRGNQPDATGYPTQKPSALYERIIEASSNEADIVFDPFAGCATTCVAAEQLSRQWVGIDIWPKASNVIVDRLESLGFVAPKYTRRTRKNLRLFLFPDNFHFTSELPERTDDGETASSYQKVKTQTYLEPWQRIQNKEITRLLAEAQWHDEEDGVVCAGCGRILELPFMHLDHINPKSDGGSNDITNRILLCAPCNLRKKDILTLRGLRIENEKAHVNWMYDRDRAEIAQSRARSRAEEVRQHYPTLPKSVTRIRLG